MEILGDKIVKFKTEINSQEWIDLIEKVNKEAFNFQDISEFARPHLTMFVPMVFTKDDTYNSIKLKNMFYSTVFDKILQYMEYYNNFGIVTRQDAFVVSKLKDGDFMKYHSDSPDEKHIMVNLHINDDFDGAEINFKDLGITYKAEAGDIFIFPASHPHSLSMLKGNPRYTVSIGLVSPKFSGKHKQYLEDSN
jgi:hypothetical protein